MRTRMIAAIVTFVVTAGAIVGLEAVGAGQSLRTAVRPSYQNIPPGQLRAMLQRKDFQLVNVHVPYAGEIEGTDALVPYTDVEARALRLWPEKSTKLVVYCQTGRMSVIAAEALVRLGYTNVLNLAGGMVAWQRAGYPLIGR